MPRITVISQDGKQSRTGWAKKEETLFSALRNLGIVMEGCCGGNGTCKKCAVEYVGQTPEIVPEEEALGAERLLAGVRLSCCHKVTEDIRVKLSSGMYFLDEAAPEMQIQGVHIWEKENPAEREYTVILDVGTTTLAAAFVRESDFKIEKVLTRENSQRRFGSDVISRIQAAGEGYDEELQAAIWEDIWSLCIEFETGKGWTPGEEIHWKQLVVSANTVMEHLLMGYSCKGLGEAPFHPVSLE